MISPVWYRGETLEYVVTVVSKGVEQDLTAATGIELQLKTAPGSADPPLAELTLGSGFTLLPQAGETLGQVSLVLPSDWLTGAATPAGVYYFDIVVLFPGSIRRYVVKPTRVIVRDVVNQP